MTQIIALAASTESDWLRRTVAELTITRSWEECVLHMAPELETWSRWLGGAAQADIIVCDLMIPRALECLKEVRKRHQYSLIIPIAEPSIPPVSYVRPDILPFGLFWRPISAQENRGTLLRALSQVYSRAEGEAGQFYIVKSRYETRKIPYEEIYYFEARDKKIVVHLADQEFSFYETISHLEQELPNFFLRCHKGYLVNRRHIEAVDWSGQGIQLERNLYVPISRGYRGQVKEKISEAY